MTRLLAIVLLLLASCASVPPEPELPQLRDRLAETTVVLVPGITGTKLVDRRSGHMVWGNTWSFFSPHDGGYAMALSITKPEADQVEAVAPIEELRLLTYRKEVYGTVARLMEKNGLQRGDLRNPRADDRFFFFLYDWRRDNISAARLLAQQLENLGRSGSRRVTLICQSNGTYICRYLVRFGDVSLADAESGARKRVGAVNIEKVILVGTSNGGALRILHELDRGRRYVKLGGRTFFPETLFTYRSLFQDLPESSADAFISAEGQPLFVDLYDSANWKTYNWSAYRPDARKRVSRHPEIFGSETDRDAYLRENLLSARRFHDLLGRDTGDGPLPRFYSIQSDAFPTPRRAMLVARNGSWVTRSYRDPEAKEKADIMSKPGDVHATVESQQSLSPAEKAAMVQPTILVKEKHFEIITTPEAQRAILEMLAE